MTARPRLPWRVSAPAALVLLAALVACGGEPAPRPAPPVALRGALAAHVERPPASLAACAARDSAGARVVECVDSLPGGSGFVAVAADTTVTEATREWLLAEAEARHAFARESTTLAQAFGAPVSARRLDDESRARDPHVAWRSECVAWRGGDSIEVVLRLDPLVDLGPVHDDVDKRVSRWVRRGTLPPAIACGL